MFQFESPAKQINKMGEEYLTFTLVIPVNGLGLSRSTGWRYYPSTGNLGAPAKNHGTREKPDYHATQWLEGLLYETVRQAAQDYFVFTGFCPEPWESREQRQKKKKGEKKNESSVDVAKSYGWTDKEYDQLRLRGCVDYRRQKDPEVLEAWMKKEIKRKGKK